MSASRHAGSKTNLYRHFDSTGRLLYVGISISAISRLQQHMQASRWAHKISSVEIEEFPTRREATEAERIAIVEEMPAYNVIHNLKTSRARTGIIRGKKPKPWLALMGKYSPPLEDGDEWLEGGDLVSLPGSYREASYHVPPSLQRVIYLKDGRIRPGISYWRKSEIMFAARSKPRRKAA